MEVIASVFILIAFLGTMYPIRDVPKGGVYLYEENPAVTIKYDVKPQSEFSDRNVIKQKYDYSCGSAALSTLLNYYLGESLTEQQVIQGLLTYGDTKLIEQRRAFSLLDMKRFVNVLGYEGTGYTAELEDLRKLDSPAIVPIDFFGYNHFVVLKGFSGDHVFVADPFMGNISFTLSQFLQMWHKNIVFLVTGGDVHLKALRLREEDLRLVTEDTEKMPREIFPPSVVKDQWDLKEASGKYRYRTIK